MTIHSPSDRLLGAALFMIGGAVAIVGLWLLWPPLAFIAVGIGLAALGIALFVEVG